MLETPASNMINRSMPRPRPPVGRHAVLHRPQVVLVDVVGLVVAQLLQPRLRFEPAAVGPRDR